MFVRTRRGPANPMEWIAIENRRFRECEALVKAGADLAWVSQSGILTS